jgi:hypothetical protein
VYYFAGALDFGVRCDASFDEVTPDDLARDAHDDLVVHLDARDLFVEPPGPARDAARPDAQSLANASITRLA